MHSVDTDIFAEVTTEEKKSNGSSGLIEIVHNHGERISIVAVSTITRVYLRVFFRTSR